jgi:hypothetical protein
VTGEPPLFPRQIGARAHVRPCVAGAMDDVASRGPGAHWGVRARARQRRAPRPPSTLVAFFATLDDASRAIVAMDESSDLSLLEVMD